MTGEIVRAGESLVQQVEGSFGVPAVVGAHGHKAKVRFLEFFVVTIENVNTRVAYGHACTRFLHWCERQGIDDLASISPMLVALYFRDLGMEHAVSTVKQHLAAVRKMLDWMVTGQILPVNPADAVRGPSEFIESGKTPVLDRSEAKRLLGDISLERLKDYRDRAFIGLMIYTFSRVSAAVGLNLEDYQTGAKHRFVVLSEKGGKILEMPVQHVLEEYLDEYIEQAGISEGALFRTALRGKRGELSDRRLSRQSAWAMVQMRAKNSGITRAIGNHSFRATGITTYMENGGDLETAQRMAGHASPRTTGLYDRRDRRVKRDAVERIIL